MAIDLNQAQLNTFWHNAEQDYRTRTLTSSETGDKFLKSAVTYLKQVCRGILESDLGAVTLGVYALRVQINAPDVERVVNALHKFFGAGHHEFIETWNGERHYYVIDLEPTIILED